MRGLVILGISARGTRPPCVICLCNFHGNGRSRPARDDARFWAGRVWSSSSGDKSAEFG